MDDEQTWLIDTPFACFGIVTVDDRVVVAPPIAWWMIDKPLPVVRRWVARKQGTMTPA